MNFQQLMSRVGVPVMGVALVAFSYMQYGWGGVAIAVGALVMWMLLHFTRMLAVMRRAAARPIGYVDSAVMLNAKLKTGMTLLHVVAMTRAFGKLLSEKGGKPEVFCWEDNGESQVTCEFSGGKLVKWEMVRPLPPQAADGAAAPEAPAVPQTTPQTAPPTALQAGLQAGSAAP